MIGVLKQGGSVAEIVCCCLSCTQKRSHKLNVSLVIEFPEYGKGRT